MELAVIAVAAAIIIAAVIMRSGKWLIIMASRGDSTEEVQAKYEYLKTHQIKCKLKTDTNPALGAVQGGLQVDGNTNVALKVHKKDVDRANELLQIYDKEADYSLHGL